MEKGTVLRPPTTGATNRIPDETSGRNARDLRNWIEEAEWLGELKRIEGADWDVEPGAITELGSHRGENSQARSKFWPQVVLRRGDHPVERVLEIRTWEARQFLGLRVVFYSFLLVVWVCSGHRAQQSFRPFRRQANPAAPDLTRWLLGKEPLPFRMF